MTWWLLIGVETEMPWPIEDYYCEFKGRQILLRPPTEQRMPMICIECSDLPMNDDSMASLGREFMSELVWVSPYRLVEVTRSSASCLMDIGPAPLRHCRGLGFYIDYLPQLQDSKPKLALAFYREARSVNSLPYSFLGYWKVVSALYSDGSEKQRQWLIDSLAKISDHNGKKRLSELRAGGESDDDIVRKRLYHSRRCAVAHATSGSVINPDDPSHEHDIWLDLPLIKAIAEYAIEFEFGVKSSQTVWKEHLYELDGFKKFFSEEAITSLKAGKTPLLQKNDLLPCINIKIATKQQLKAFRNLKVRIRQVKSGNVVVHCTSPDDLFQVGLLLDFANERFDFNPLLNTVIADDGTPEAIQLGIDYFQFCYELFSNGRVQVYEHGTTNLLGKKDPFIGTNINLGATLSDWKGEISRLQEELARRTAVLELPVTDILESALVDHKPPRDESSEELKSVAILEASADVPQN